METHQEIYPPREGDEDGLEPVRESYYRRFKRRFVFVVTLSSLVPLLAVGWGISLRYSNFARARMIENLETRVDYHRRIVGLFLSERRSGLELIAGTQQLSVLLEPGRLAQMLELLNSRFGDSFTDLGVIGEDGAHLGYVGPYDLKDKNYGGTFWFQAVMERGTYVSDMFLGYRQSPHFIMATVREEGGTKWILRATIETEAFRSLVEDVKIGRTGEVFILNREGTYQTSPRFGGRIMEQAPVGAGAPGPGIMVDDNRRTDDGVRRIMARAWLPDPPWVLVVQQDYEEAFAEVNQVNTVMLVMLHLAALMIFVVSLVSARRMVEAVRRRDEEVSALNRHLVEAGKMAVIGEVSAGVAHEINNPLAIIMTEKQLLADAAQQAAELEPRFEEQLQDSLNQISIQLARCRRITQNLLRFSRRSHSVMEGIDLNELLGEMVELIKREAMSKGIEFSLDFDPNLPLIRSDPAQLQQVFLNLVTNAIDAHEGKESGRVTLRTRAGEEGTRVLVQVEDRGMGIRPELRLQIFDPFFTTKPPGRGTGLGLTICRDILERLKGELSLESEVGEGTVFTVSLPLERVDGKRTARDNQVRFQVLKGGEL